MFQQVYPSYATIIGWPWPRPTPEAEISGLDGRGPYCAGIAALTGAACTAMSNGRQSYGQETNRFPCAR